MLAPVCLALVRSYAVSFGLVVLPSFGFALVLLVITPFTQTLVELYSRATCACNRTPCSSSPMPSVPQPRQSDGKLFGGERFMKGASGIPSHNMKKIRVPKKDNVVAVLGHKGTFQVLSVVLIHETGLLTCARWKRDVCLQRWRRGFLGHHSCIC